MANSEATIYGIIAAGVVVFFVGGIWYLCPRYRDISGEAQQYQENIVLGARARADWEEERGRRLERPRRAARREEERVGHSHSTSISFELA